MPPSAFALLPGALADPSGPIVVLRAPTPTNKYGVTVNAATIGIVAVNGQIFPNGANLLQQTIPGDGSGDGDSGGGDACADYTRPSAVAVFTNLCNEMS